MAQPFHLAVADDLVRLGLRGRRGFAPSYLCYNMSGRRPLNRQEERQLLRVVRQLPARQRAIITTQWLSALRISEVLRLTVGHVWRNEKIVDQIGIAPRHLKGKRGRTRWVPVLPELRRALTHQLWSLRLKFNLTPDLPLFPTRQADGEGNIRPITRVQAHTIIKRAFAQASIVDDGRLGTHSLRKTMAQNVYRHSHDILVVKAVLNHAHVATSELYLETDAAEVAAAIASCDFTRRPRQQVQVVAAPATINVPVSAVTLPTVAIDPESTQFEFDLGAELVASGASSAHSVAA